MRVLKRDKREVDFDKSKIEAAVKSAMISIDITDENLPKEIADFVSNQIKGDIIEVEEIQDLVEKALIHFDKPEIAKEYIIYRDIRSRQRESNSDIVKTIRSLTVTDSKDMNLKRENANIDADTSMGTMLKYGSEVSKMFSTKYLLRPEVARAHMSGDIHIHDLDFYPLTETCCQIDISKLFKNGFSTGHGTIREPSNISTAAQLSAVVIQANQNEMHGGQAIPAFDFFMAPYVAKSFVKKLCSIINILGIVNPECLNVIKEKLNKYLEKNKLILDTAGKKYTQAILYNIGQIDEETFHDLMSKAFRATDEETHQAMEGIIHNLNTLHSRAGAQVPFSSLNYGTDTSSEGRMVIGNLLKALYEGMGRGETPIFPVHIFKVKEGVNYNPYDPNYDLFKLACSVSAKRLFPNFSFLDSSFNKKYYKPGDPNTEVAYMGCRTRVMGNVYDPSRETTFGRGNLSFTSINLPRIAIEASKDNSSIEDKVNKFFEILEDRMNLVFIQLDDRFKVQSARRVKNYPFLMGQGIWIDSDKLDYEDKVKEVLKHGTLTVGFIGLAEALKMLTGYHHGESDSSQKLGLKIVGFMRKMCDDRSQEMKMNYSLIATPAEGLSGRFTRIDKKKYGIIPGVTDREYYTNSFHVPVYYNTDAFHKIDVEAPYHELTNGGHISYVEMDGDPTNNVEAFEQIIRYMHDAQIGYGSINHAVDRCDVCGYTGIIDDKCPRCGNDGVHPVDLEILKKLQKDYPDIKIPNCSCGE